MDYIYQKMTSFSLLKHPCWGIQFQTIFKGRSDLLTKFRTEISKRLFKHVYVD